MKVSRTPPLGLLLVGLAACAPEAPKDVTVVLPSHAQTDEEAAAETACARQGDATHLAAEADARLSVNVMGAIAQYAEARALAPKDHTIVFRHAMALKKTENWPAEQAALSKATELAPGFANYWYELGLTFLRQAEAGERESYARGKAPFETCTHLDPNFAECWYGLAQTALWTDDVELALASYTRAIELDPGQVEFYSALASAYLDLKLYAESGGVVEAALARLESNTAGLDRIHLLAAEIYAATGQVEKRLGALEAASEVASNENLEAWYFLAFAYVGQSPPDLEKARRALQVFIKRGCRGQVEGARNQARQRGQCEASQALAQRLGP